MKSKGFIKKMSLAKSVAAYEKAKGKQISPLRDMVKTLSQGPPNHTLKQDPSHRHEILAKNLPVQQTCSDFESLDQLLKLAKKRESFLKGL